MLIGYAFDPLVLSMRLGQLSPAQLSARFSSADSRADFFVGSFVGGFSPILVIYDPSPASPFLSPVSRLRTSRTSGPLPPPPVLSSTSAGSGPVFFIHPLAGMAD